MLDWWIDLGLTVWVGFLKVFLISPTVQKHAYAHRPIQGVFPAFTLHVLGKDPADLHNTAKMQSE